MIKKIIIILGILMIVGTINAEGNQPTQQSNKLFLNPFYRASMTNGQNYTYNVTINPPDGLSSVSSAIISFDVYISPTVNFNIWVNDKSCNTPLYTISTTYAGAGQSRITFDCSNIITSSGIYTITLKPTSQNTGAITGWIDLTYSNNPIGTMTVHGTEYTSGQKGKIWIQLINASGSDLTNAVCYTDIYTPLSTEFLERGTMTNLNHDGIYYYDLIIPTRQGVYPVIATCYYTAGQSFNYGTQFSITNGTLNTGTIFDTKVLDANYLTTTESSAGTGDPRRYLADINFTNGTICANISESLFTGISIYWTGRWNSNLANDVITMWLWNYTSSKWIRLDNTITGAGTGSKSVSNSLSFNNITKAGFVNSTGSGLRLRFNDTVLADGSSSSFDYDYVAVSCDQLANPQWQTVKGSSELHVSNPELFTTDNGNYNITNQTLITHLVNGTNISEIYYTGIFTNKFTIESGTIADREVTIEYQGLHSIPCNSIISFYFVNDTGYYQLPFNTQRQTTEDHCSINFGWNLSTLTNYQFEAHARNVWESDLRSTNTGLGSIYPLIDGGCRLWQIVKGLPNYITPKNQSNEAYNYYYRACANFYDDFYWFNKTLQQSYIDKSQIVNEQTYVQYESDYISSKLAEDKLTVVSTYLLDNLGAVNDYSKLLIDNPLGDGLVNTTDQRYWANVSTLYQTWKLINDSCGTGTCKINSSNLNITVTATVNNTAISESVWTYNGTINSNIIVQFVNVIWSFSGTISTNILNSIGLSNWNSPSRNLTFTQDDTNYSKMAEQTWNYSNGKYVDGVLA